MIARPLCRWWPAVAAGLLLLAGGARADFSQIEDFDGLDPGPIDGQNGWIAPSALSEVATDPDDAGNAVLSVVTESTVLIKEAFLPAGVTRMLFFRFRFDDQLTYSFGLSDVARPTRFDYFEAELSLTNATSELRVNDDGQYEVLDVLQPGVWYYCWMLIDNAASESQVWLHSRPGEPATAADQLDADDGETVFDFRNGTTRDLLTFFIKTGGGNGVAGPLFLDDIYLESTDGLSLSCPVMDPTAVVELPARLEPELARPFPNPFFADTHVGFTLPRPGPVRLTVHDVAGRQVAVLAEGNHGAGVFVADWDGKDANGVLAGSGIYFTRLQAGEFRATRKLVLTR